MESHNKSALDDHSRSNIATSNMKAATYWPVTFPKIKNNFKKVEPAVNEPIILRYNAKAQFNSDCENLTFGKYRSVNYESHGKSAAQLRRKYQSGKLYPLGEVTERDLTAPADEERSRKLAKLNEAKSKLFTKFPEIKTVFSRRKPPVIYLKQSMEYEF